MNGHIEPLSGIIRIGEDCREYGSPYNWCSALRYLSPKEVEVLATIKAPTMPEWRAIRDVLIENGIEKAFYVRHKNGKVRRVELTR